MGRLGPGRVLMCAKCHSQITSIPCLACAIRARAQYGSLSEGQNDRDLDSPTSAAPGTAEKIGVLRQRATRGLALFHPRDAVLTDAA